MKMRSLLPIGIVVLLLLAPTTVGILLLHRPAVAVPASGINPAAQSATGTASGTHIREEVLQSVLSQPTASPQQNATDTRPNIMRDGAPVPIRNGEAVQLGDDYQAEVFFAPYPPTGSTANLDLYLTRTSGEVVPDAEISMDYDMLYMSHSPLKTRVRNLGDGHYLFPFNFSMYGIWGLDTRIRIPGQTRRLSLLLTIYVWPN